MARAPVLKRRLVPVTVRRPRAAAGAGIRSIAAAAPAARPQPEPGVEFTEVTPSLAVTDVGRSRAFYEKLGFRVAAQLPPSGRAEWLRLERDRVALLVWNQVIAPPHVIMALRQARGAGNTVRIAVSDVDRMVHQLQDKGIHLDRPLETMPDGVRECSVLDPDGYVIEFAARVASPAPGAAAS